MRIADNDFAAEETDDPNYADEGAADRAEAINTGLAVARRG
jgi:hypothetical protein